MIRTSPQHNTTNPPGQIVNPIQQEKTLAKEIGLFQSKEACKEAYKLGYKEGYEKGYKARLDDLQQGNLGSEAAR